MPVLVGLIDLHLHVQEPIPHSKYLEKSFPQIEPKDLEEYLILPQKRKVTRQSWNINPENKPYLRDAASPSSRPMRRPFFLKYNHNNLLAIENCNCVSKCDGDCILFILKSLKCTIIALQQLP